MTHKGLELIEIAPGIDLKRDVLEQMEFVPAVSPNLKLMDERIYYLGLMHLESQSNKKNQIDHNSGRVLNERLG